MRELNVEANDQVGVKDVDRINGRLHFILLISCPLGTFSLKEACSVYPNQKLLELMVTGKKIQIQ